MDERATTPAPIVYVVDDDAGALRSLCWLIEQAGLPVRAYGSGREFLDEYREEEPGCLVLDVRMPDLGGLEVQKRLLEGGLGLPIIFLTAFGDVPTCAGRSRRGPSTFWKSRWTTRCFSTKYTWRWLWNAIFSHATAGRQGRGSLQPTHASRARGARHAALRKDPQGNRRTERCNRANRLEAARVDLPKNERGKRVRTCATGRAVGWATTAMMRCRESNCHQTLPRFSAASHGSAERSRLSGGT